MIIAATADIHAPRFFDDFVRVVDTISVKPDIFLIAGDMVDRGDVGSYEGVYNTLFGKITCPIVACFGNTEYQELREQFKQRYREIKFLDDEAAIMQVGRTVIGIVGTTGSLDEPTSWQRTNISNIESLYRDRVATVEKLLGRMRTDVSVLLMHYAPTYKTLEGENPNFYKNLGSRMYEAVILNKKPTLVIHAHSHRGLKSAWIDTVPIFNASFPLNKQIVIIDTGKDLKPGITKFI